MTDHSPKKPFNIVKIFFTAEIILCLIYILLIFSYHKIIVKQEQVKIQHYATSVAGSVWNINVREVTEYLSVVCLLSNYDNLVIRENSGNEFAVIKNREVDNAFIKFPKPIILETDIVFEERIIGHINVEWYADTATVAAITLLITGLISISLWFFLKTVANKRNLEIRISERTNELQTSKQELSAIIENIPSMFVAKDAEKLRYVRFNKAGEKLLGIPREDVIGKNDYDLFPKEQADFFVENDRDVLRSGKPKEIAEEPIATLAGERLLHTCKISINDNNGQPLFLLGFSEDITEQKKAEENRQELEKQLQQAHKMEAIGTLAGGIAHDFNNILASIIGYSELAQDDIPADNPAADDIDQVIKSSRRAAELVQQILTFSRKSDHDLQPLNPHLIVKEVLRMLGSSLPSTVIIDEDIEKGCGRIMADPTNIHQIMLNLCTNARHAMENETGTLSVKLYRQEIATEEIEHEPGVSAGPFVVMSVSDTGCGMDEALKEHVFEPYFTTKEVGKGTGMGLAVIHGIIKDYNGFIRVDSTPGGGSTFSVYIPALPEKAISPQDYALKKSENNPSLPTGHEHLLVVDDEPQLVKILQKQLEKYGYAVTITTESMDAMEMIRSQPDQFDLLITDQTMPILSGVELVKAVKEINPALPVILCTGHSDVISKKEALALGIKKYVPKPIKRDELILTIRDVLDSD